MGLIMLILIGTVPTAYRAQPHADMPDYPRSLSARSARCQQSLAPYGKGVPRRGLPARAVASLRPASARPDRARDRLLATARRASRSGRRYQVAGRRAGRAVSNVAQRHVPGRRGAPPADQGAAARARAPTIARTSTTYPQALDGATKFIPLWVKVAVAIALGLGTMVGWKRIVVTVGEKIGKSHLTYAQGGSAELVAMADHRRRRLARPAGLDHPRAVLGRRRHHGGQRLGAAMATLRKLLMAWVLTLPASIVIAGALFWLFRHLF
jgi:PiT family inorganic phosphate transporter